MTIIYLFLWMLSIPLWGWYCWYIWKENKGLAALSFFLVIPGIIFAAKNWDNPNLNLRASVYANIALVLMLCIVRLKMPDDWAEQLVGGSEYTQKTRKAEKKRASSEMENWCNKQEASYDPDLKTCVERKKTEVLAQGLDAATFSRLSRFLEKSGLKGELDRSQSAESLNLSKSAEIADVASYYFLPFSMSQPRLSFYLCVSASACANYVENLKDRSVVSLIRNNNLLLSVPWESLEEPKTKELINVFLDFKNN